MGLLRNHGQTKQKHQFKQLRGRKTVRGSVRKIESPMSGYCCELACFSCFYLHFYYQYRLAKVTHFDTIAPPQFLGGCICSYPLREVWPEGARYS